jgi:hypothetical protein
MNATDKKAAKAKTTERQLAAAAGSDKSDERLPNNPEGTSDQRKPVEWEDVLLGISHHLDDGTSERKAVNDRLLAMESEIKRRGSPGFTRYLLAICIGVAATLAWQSYGETTKHMIARGVQQLGWTKTVPKALLLSHPCQKRKWHRLCRPCLSRKRLPPPQSIQSRYIR